MGFSHGTLRHLTWHQNTVKPSILGAVLVSERGDFSMPINFPNIELWVFCCLPIPRLVAQPLDPPIAQKGIAIPIAPMFSAIAGYRAIPLQIWAGPGVLWKKAPRAMRAMRGKTLETVPFNRTLGGTKSFLKVLSN